MQRGGAEHVAGGHVRSVSQQCFGGARLRFVDGDMQRRPPIQRLDARIGPPREKDLDDQLFRLRIQKSMGQLEAAHKLKALRRDLARVKTALREKESV